MSTIKNSLLITNVIDALYAVIGRRTLDSFAVQILKTTIKKLEPTYPFLSSLQIRDDFFLEEGVHVDITAVFDTISPSKLGEAIDALIRVIYMELIDTIGADVGLFFITEFKTHLGDTYIDELRICGVHLESIQLEQHLQYQIRGITPMPPEFPGDEGPEQPQYSWDAVSTWKYEDNVCRLYDSDGKLLDALQLDLIIEDYVERVVEPKKQQLVKTPKTTMLKVTEKDQELLEMMRRRDTDVDSAVTLLHISQQKLDAMVQKLLALELLQYVSDNEVKLTEKALEYLSEKKK